MAKRDDDEPGFALQAIRGLSSSTRHNAFAYGYSLGLTGAFGILDVRVGRPDPLDIVLFGLGGAFAFTFAIAATTRGYRKGAHEQPREVRVVGSSLGFVSSAGSILVAWGLSVLLTGWVAWLVAAFVASAMYLVLSALELALARIIWPLVPADEIADPE